MKHKKRNLALALLLSLSLCLIFTSCDLPWEVSTSIGDRKDKYEGIFDFNDELDLGSTDKPDVIPPDNDENGSDGELSDDKNEYFPDDRDDKSGVEYAANVGLRSVVSIYAEFGDKVGVSSGVIYDLNIVAGSAFIITNYHAVYTEEYGLSENIDCYLFGMESVEYAIPATFVGGSPNYDLAILRVDDSKVIRAAGAHGSITEARFANSDQVFPGQTAIAIGNPKMSGIAVTSGIVSVDSEQIYIQSSTGNGSVQMRVIRVDTPVNLGNSGGGLFDENGNIIGIVNARSSSTSTENIGYAIPSNVARAVADNIIDYCYGTDCTSVMRAMLGVTVTISSLSTNYNIDTGRLERIEEVSVHEVTPGALADGIFEVGDIIKTVSIGNQSLNITRQHQLIDAMLDARVGDTVSFTLIRNGEEIELRTIITEACLTAY
jgi:serine protease Do